MEFTGVFGHLFNSLTGSFLRKFNFTAIVNRGGGFGEPVDSNGSYDGCLGQLQRNQSDVMLRFADYPMDCINVTQGDVFFDTQVVFGQLYYQDGKMGKFQILSAVMSLDHVFAYIILYFITVLTVLKIARVFINRHKCRVYYTHGRRRVITVPVTNHTVANTFAHAFRFGSIRAKRPHRRLVFLSLSIFSLILIHIFYSSIKTELVVVPEPEHWDSFDDVIRDHVKPIFIQEMETVQYFKEAQPGSSEHRMWQYAMNNYDVSATSVPATMKSFFTAGVELHSRSAILMLDDVMGPLVQNAACSLNAYNHTQFAISLSGKSYDFDKTFYLYFTTDPLGQTFQKGAVSNELFTSYAAVKFRWFSKSVFEMGITLKTLEDVKTENIAGPFVTSLPPSGKENSVVNDCKCPSVFKPRPEKDKMVTFGNTITLGMSYFMLNGLAFVILLCERTFARR